ncbi:MAG TPA: aldo/keto reductase [Chloroflexota bacterium]|nr:aldo/keto reductase [Chloroflexota bacterium]
MRYRTLGRTAFVVSEIGLGSWELGGSYFLRDRSSSNNDPAGYADVAEEKAIATVHWGLANGLTFIDTAPIYGNGESERRVARALAAWTGPTTHRVVVETKLGVYGEDGRYRPVFSGDVVRRELAVSQQRLGREVLDIDLLHSPSREEFGDGESLSALVELKKQGKVRWIGLSSSYDVQHTLEILETGLLDVLQIPLSLLRPEWKGVLEACRRHDVGVVVREPLYNGYLTGRIDENTEFAADDQRRVWGRDRHLDLVRRAKEFSFLASDSRTFAQAALKWILSFPEVSVVIAGSASPAELAENMAVSDAPDLNPLDLERVARLHGSTSPVHA